MAELPGWDRDRLDTATSSDVEAARLLIFARKVRPVLEVDVADRIRDLERMDRPASPAMLKAERAREIEALQQFRQLQAVYREWLDLDDQPTGLPT